MAHRWPREDWKYSSLEMLDRLFIMTGSIFSCHFMPERNLHLDGAGVEPRRAMSNHHKPTLHHGSSGKISKYFENFYLSTIFTDFLKLVFCNFLHRIWILRFILMLILRSNSIINALKHSILKINNIDIKLWALLFHFKRISFCLDLSTKKHLISSFCFKSGYATRFLNIKASAERVGLLKERHFILLKLYWLDRLATSQHLQVVKMAFFDLVYVRQRIWSF